MASTRKTWEAKGSYIFEGKDCIAIFDTANASEKTLVARAAITAKAVNCHDDMLAALQAVVRVADRNTVEFNLARAAIAKASA